MTEKEILIAFLGKTLNMTPEQVAPLLYKKGDDDTLTEEVSDTALAEIQRLDAERVAKLKPNTKEFFDNGYKKAQAEIADAHEKTLRAKFNVDSEGKMKGDDLLNAIKAAMAKQDDTLPADKVKIHPEFLAMEANYRKQLEDLEATWKQKAETMQSTFDREKSWSDVSGRIRQEFKALNPILPKDAAKADASVELFVNTHFRDYDFKPTEDGKFLVMKDGARVDNAHGHPLYLGDLVKQSAERLFDFEAQPPAGQAGNTNDGKGAVNIRFKNEDEYWTKLEAEPDGAKRTEMTKAWVAQESQAAGV